mmetsp:Transcript_29844/g.79383  ORF Transcript_29844/g.79383 Transcript_29844/m.79383 type:complete len:216 (-) Transcript_29844:34-681(-)
MHRSSCKVSGTPLCPVQLCSQRSVLVQRCRRSAFLVNWMFHRTRLLAKLLLDMSQKTKQRCLHHVVCQRCRHQHIDINVRRICNLHSGHDFIQALRITRSCTCGSANVFGASIRSHDTRHTFAVLLWCTWCRSCRGGGARANHHAVYGAHRSRGTFGTCTRSLSQNPCPVSVSERLCLAHIKPGFSKGLQSGSIQSAQPFTRLSATTPSNAHENL